jgi:hypothetical protein
LIGDKVNKGKDIISTNYSYVKQKINENINYSMELKKDLLDQI